MRLAAHRVFTRIVGLRDLGSTAMKAGLALAGVALACGTANADPGFELGQSTRGGHRVSLSPDVRVDQRIGRVGRHQRGVVGWDATSDGEPIDHEAFYRLVGRPDFAQTHYLRTHLGAASVIIGILTLAGGFVVAPRRNGAKLGPALVIGGAALTGVGVERVGNPDPLSPAEAAQLADDYANARRFGLALGGSF